MKRCNNWPVKLALFLEEKQSQPFDWKTNNCCFFACDWLAILAGVDPAESYRPRVTSALAMGRILKEEGGVEAMADKDFPARGWRNVDVKMAQRGDIVLADTPEGPAIGVCGGAVSWFAGPKGLSAISTIHQCRKAWKI